MIKRITELVKTLNEARDAYYLNDTELMSNKEYDALFDELVALESQTGIILPDSPTQTVGAVNLEKGNSLKKVTHEYPALSLDKIKVTDEAFKKDLLKFMGGNKGFLSFKLDGLTIVATYEDGELIRAVTRGNGITGEDITANAKFFSGLPQEIPYKEHLIVRGEALITYSEFERINSTINDIDSKYKNPRNLASGTVRALDAKICKDRHINFCLFEAVTSYKKYNSKIEVLSELEEIGFSVVKRIPVDVNTVMGAIETLTNEAKESDFPTDGLVLTYDDIALSESVGSTGHHSRAGLAIKWGDETAETTLRDIEWSASRTGLLNPVAVFDPVELEGTTVSRASLHNINYIYEKDLQVGDTITVYKANMIIPQIDKNLSAKTNRPVSLGGHKIPKICPVCNGPVIFDRNGETLNLKCSNPNCAAKKLYSFVHLAERDCLNIAGLSEETLSKFINAGYLTDFCDIYHLNRYKNEIVGLDGFGIKSYDKLILAIEKSRKCDFVSFIHAMGIPNIGKGQAKLLKAHLESVYDEKHHLFNSDHDGSYDLIYLMVCLEETGYDWSVIDGFGGVIAKSLSDWIEHNFYSEDYTVRNLLKELSFTDKKPEATGSPLLGLTFVITGSVTHFKNREELQSKIEELGGKTSGSVSAKTSYLINNDVTSSSSKNKKAKELGIPIINEEDFLKMI